MASMQQVDLDLQPPALWHHLHGVHAAGLTWICSRLRCGTTCMASMQQVDLDLQLPALWHHLHGVHAASGASCCTRDAL